MQYDTSISRMLSHVQPFHNTCIGRSSWSLRRVIHIYARQIDGIAVWYMYVVIRRSVVVRMDKYVVWNRRDITKVAYRNLNPKTR